MKIYPDGREVLDLTKAADRREYKARTEQMTTRQQNVCPLCGGLLHHADATFDHQGGRGMGGSRRDDRIEVDGKWINAAVHYYCNTDKGSRRYHWINNQEYVPI